MLAPAEAGSATRAVAAVEELLRRARGRWLTLPAIEESIARAVPDVEAGLQRRQLIATSVRALVDAGRVELPRTPASWQDGSPRLPRWVSRVAVERPPGGRKVRRHPWMLELMWAQELPLTLRQLDELKRVQAWLRTPRPADDPHCSVRERSVQVFRDDKRLEALAGGSLFAPGRLSFELLDCSPTAPPLAVQELRPLDDEQARDWLVVENAPTFRSIAACPEAIPGISLLVFGAGAQASAGLPALLAERAGPAPDRVLWFGDVDRGGLTFAIAAELALLASGMPVLPHKPLYRAVMQGGCTASSRAGKVSDDEATRLASWLRDPELEAFAVDVLSAGERAMQEQVGPRELRQLAASR